MKQERTGTSGHYVLTIFLDPKTRSLIGLAVLIILFFSGDLKAQSDDRPVRIGAGGGFGSNISQTHIESFAGDFLCGVFEKGSAPGTSFFGRMEIPLPMDNFSLVPQVGYKDLSSSFVTNPFTIEHARDLNNDTIQIFRQRSFSTDVKTIS